MKQRNACISHFPRPSKDVYEQPIDTLEKDRTKHQKETLLILIKQLKVSAVIQ